MSKVSFWRGTYASYLLSDIDLNCLYFIEDKNQLYRGYTPVGLNVIHVDEFPASNIIPLSLYKLNGSTECRLYDGADWLVIEHPWNAATATATIVGDYLEVEAQSLPVAVKTDKGNIYFLDNETLSQEDNIYRIYAPPYLAYDGSTVLSGTWEVYFAGGIKGDTGTPIDEAAIEQIVADKISDYGFASGSVPAAVEDGFIVVSAGSIPVALSTDKGNYYYIQNESLTYDAATDTYRLDPAPYLAYDNSTSITGEWIVYFAGGIKGADADETVVKQLVEAKIQEHEFSDGKLTAVIANGKLTVATSSLPVAVTTDKGNLYYLQSDSVVYDSATNSYTIDPGPYLVYDNSSELTGTWTVHFAGGIQGEKGEPGTSGVSTAEVTDIVNNRIAEDVTPQLSELDTEVESITADVSALMDARNYTAFEVLATDTDIAAGTVDEVTGLAYKIAVPANMLHRMNLRTEEEIYDCNAVIDWGDGSTSILKNGDYEYVTASGSTNQFVCSHTYSTPGRYIIKIFGNRYYSIHHGPIPANNGVAVPASNLMCRVFDFDLPIAPHLVNMSSFCKEASKLLKVAASTAYTYRFLNMVSLFAGARNLQEVTGLSCLNASQLINTMFAYCSNLTSVSIKLPRNTGLSTYNNIFYNCVNLEADINDILPTGGFDGFNIDVSGMFASCKKLTGTVPAGKLWNNPNATFVSTENAFSDCSDAIRAQVPVSWGGTLVPTETMVRRTVIVNVLPENPEPDTLYLVSNAVIS